MGSIHCMAVDMTDPIATDIRRFSRSFARAIKRFETHAYHLHSSAVGMGSHHSGGPVGTFYRRIHRHLHSLLRSATVRSFAALSRLLKTKIVGRHRWGWGNGFQRPTNTSIRHYSPWSQVAGPFVLLLLFFLQMDTCSVYCTAAYELDTSNGHCISVTPGACVDLPFCQQSASNCPRCTFHGVSPKRGTRKQTPGLKYEGTLFKCDVFSGKPRG